MKEKNKINVKKPKEFTIQINKCGLDSCNGSYKIMKDKNALKLLSAINFIVSKDFVGKENQFNLQYDLAIVILSSLNGWDVENLEKDVKNAKKIYDEKWVLDDKNEK